VATVLVLSLAAVLVLVGAAATALAAVAVARQRAASAADLSALAAAQVVLSGPDVACGRAAELAERVGGRLSACDVDGDVVAVVVQVRPPGVVGRLGVASARARAGPAQLDLAAEQVQSGVSAHASGCTSPAEGPTRSQSAT